MHVGAEDSGLQASCLSCRVQGIECRVWKFEAWGLELGVKGLELKAAIVSVIQGFGDV